MHLGQGEGGGKRSAPTHAHGCKKCHTPNTTHTHCFCPSLFTYPFGQVVGHNNSNEPLSPSPLRLRTETPLPWINLLPLQLSGLVRGLRGLKTDTEPQKEVHGIATTTTSLTKSLPHLVQAWFRDNTDKAAVSQATPTVTSRLGSGTHEPLITQQRHRE